MAGKVCRYGCNAQLTWDNAKSKFVEADGTEHSKERCAYLKSLLPKTPVGTTTAATQPTAGPKFDNHYAERDAAIAQAHADNQKMHQERMSFDKERLAFDKEKMASDKQLTNAVLALAGEIHSLKEIAEIFVRAQPGTAQFKPANNITSEVSS